MHRSVKYVSKACSVLGRGKCEGLGVSARQRGIGPPGLYVCVFGGRLQFRQGSRRGLFEKMTFEQFERDIRHKPGRYLEEEHSRQRN